MRAGVLFRLAVFATLAAAPALAQECPPARTITLAAGDRVGALTPGYKFPPLAEREVVLSFDDGPSTDVTPRILDILKERCLPATFFAIGPNAADHPDLVKRILADGHVIGGHSNSHTDLTAKPLADATSDIADGLASLTAAGANASLFRFPLLASTPLLTNWLHLKGMAAVSADIDPRDWAGDPPEETLSRLKEQLAEKRGGVILLHDSQPNTAELLPALLDYLRANGYTVVRLAGPAR
jgi:peptidoglycan/xylan/chitin deacetylase (PgdA/CDA1 family)